MTKLQSVLALSPDQVAAIPPPLMRIRELEQENTYLLRENEELRRQLEEKNTQLRPDIGRRSTMPTTIVDGDRRIDRSSDMNLRRRRTDDVYMVRLLWFTFHTRKI